MNAQFILASKSPRRQELLRQLGFQFEVRVAEIEEGPRPGEAAGDYALRIAAEKAAAVRVADLPVLGADTDVVLDGRILGKPKDEADAVRMLRVLSGRSHQVFSAVVLLLGARRESALSVTDVSFATISEETARRYWASGEPADKAGSYGIQGLGAQFVKEIRGSYSGVVGLPLHETCALLEKFGIRSLQ